MAWLSQNWIWILAGLAFVALHLFGHGGHGGHGRSDRGAVGPHVHDDASAAPPAHRAASGDSRR